MPAKVKPQDLDIKINFGGGINSRATPDQIDVREAADGYNFYLDLTNKELRPRPSLDYIGSLPAFAAGVVGGGSMIDTNGAVHAFFQSDSTLYNWDGSNFTFGAVYPGKWYCDWRDNFWGVGDTDLSILGNHNPSPFDTRVLKWTEFEAFIPIPFVDTSGVARSPISARYVTVSNGRAWYANICDNTGLDGVFQNLVVGSQQDRYDVIDTTNVPSSSLSASDPFFIPIPDQRPINGMVDAFQTRIFSTHHGNLWQLDGTDARDFAFKPFYAGSAATGYESLVNIGNDVIYGRQGRIESVRNASAFNDTEADDLSVQIADQIREYKYPQWRNIYNARTNLVLCMPALQDYFWVFNNALRTTRDLDANALNQYVFQQQPSEIAGKLSPWMKWQPSNSLFEGSIGPSFARNMLDPSDGKEYVFLGSFDGQIYRLEGAGSGGDSGLFDINTSWTSKAFSAPLDAEAYTLEGYIKYRKNFATTITLTFLCQGKTAFNNSITLTLPASNSVGYYGGGDFQDGNYVPGFEDIFGTPCFYGDDTYYGFNFANRLLRQYFSVPGQMNEFQVRIDVASPTTFRISEIGLRMRASSQ